VAAFLTSWIPIDGGPPTELRNPFWAYHVSGRSRDNKNQFSHGPDQDFPYQGTLLFDHVVRLLSTLVGLYDPLDGTRLGDRPGLCPA